MPQSSVAGHLYPQPGPSTGIHGHLRGIISPHRLLSSRSLAAPFLLVSLSNGLLPYVPQRGATFPAPLICCGGVMATLFQMKACPMATVPLREERGVPEACLSFLTKLWACGARVLQNGLLHLKSDSPRGRRGLCLCAPHPTWVPQAQRTALLGTHIQTTPTPTSFLETLHTNCRIRPGHARLPHICRQPRQRHSITIPHTGHSGAQTDPTADDLYPFLDPGSHSTPTYKPHLDVTAHTHLW